VRGRFKFSGCGVGANKKLELAQGCGGWQLHGWWGMSRQVGKA